MRTPNVLLIVLESTRASHLSCYGYHRQTTPNLDRLAADGVLYEQAISSAPWTLPSHASLFTGLYTSQHGTHFGQPYLGRDIPTLAEVLQQRGYRTAAFSTNPWVSEELGLQRGFEVFRWAERTLEWLKPLFPAETKLEKALRYLRDPWYPVSHRNNRLLRQWIDQARAAHAPFFAYSLYFDPHYPLRPRQPYASRYLGPRYNRWWRLNKDPDRFMAGAATMGDEDFEVLTGLYDSRLASMDAILGRLFDGLRRDGILDDTLLFVVADHGENLGEHGLMSHQYCVYDTLIHVPLIIHYPPAFLAGGRVAAQVQPLEIFATVMDVLGADLAGVSPTTTGRSLIPAKLAGAPRSYSAAEYLAPNLDRMRRLYPDKDLSRYDRSLRALRGERYKYIWTSDGRPELYDLQEDPGETDNLTARQPEMVARMQVQLDDWLVSVGRPPSKHALAADMDAAVVQRLRALGYL